MVKLKNALTATGFKFAHIAWSHAPAAPYLVWSESEPNDLHAGGHNVERIQRGSVDLFTRDDTGSDQAKVENELKKIEGFNWSLESIQYEEETGLIHFEWYWSAV